MSMEPVAHFGIRKGEKDLEILIKWTDGQTQSFKIKELNKEIIVKKIKFLFLVNFYLE